MATGLSIPIGVDTRGGAALKIGSDNDDKIIRLALGDDDNENAFQQNIGVGALAIFGVSNEQLQSSIMRRVFDVFQRFEAQKRFTLMTNTIQWSTNSKTQELTLSFRYITLETDQERTFVQAFSASGGSASTNSGT